MARNAHTTTMEVGRSRPDRPTLADRRPTAAGVLASLLPSMTYVASAGRVGSTTAMVLASTVAAIVAVDRRRRGAPLGPVLRWSLAYLLLRTLLGVATGSEAVYFGAGLLLSVGVAVAVGATAWTRAPAATHLLPLVVRYRHLGPAHPAYRRAAAHVSAAWAVAELVMTGLEVWHLSHATGTEFLIVRATVAMPAMAVVVFLLVFYVRARLDPLEFQLAAAAADAPTRPRTTTVATARGSMPTGQPFG